MVDAVTDISSVWIWSIVAAVGIGGLAYEFARHRNLIPARMGDLTFHRGLHQFRQDQGRGDVAARAIDTAPSFRRAETIFNDCRHDANPRRLDLLHKAMIKRLHKEGRTPETWAFLESERREFARVNMADFMTSDEADEELEKQYLWMIIEWEESLKSSQENGA